MGSSGKFFSGSRSGLFLPAALAEGLPSPISVIEVLSSNQVLL